MKHLLLVFCILAVSLAGCAPATSAPFQDSFDSAGDWTLVENSQASATVTGGALQITVRQPESLAWSIVKGKTFDDFTLDVDAQPVAGPDDNDYGVIVRHVDDQNFYRFEISADGYYNVQKREKGQWKKLVTDWAPSSAIHPGKTANHLRVVCAGPRLTFWVNDAQVAEVQDDAFARGSVGLLAGTLAQGGVQVTFDNLQIGK